MLASSKPEAISGFNSGKYNFFIQSSRRLLLIFLFGQLVYFGAMHEFYNYYLHKKHPQPRVFAWVVKWARRSVLLTLISNDGSAGATAV